jgi:glc operon protein GlcG
MPSDSPDLGIVTHAGLALSACRAVAQAAEAAALAKDCRMCIAILDGGGHLQHFVRMDGTHIASIEVAIAKARCALAFRRPTKAFADAVAANSMALIALPGIVPFEGGVPLIYRGEVVGAIGISGGTPQLDGEVGQAGAGILLTEGEHA